MSSFRGIPRVVLSPFGISYLFRRNPWVPLWWSVILPGFGHIHLGQNIKGLTLMFWEILINHQAKINLAIYYTVIGEGQQAAAVLDYRWASIYPLFYIFAMVDSYRIAMEYNHLDRMETVQQKRRFDRVSVSILGVHGMDRRNPIYAAIWSALVIGLGHLHCNRMLKALVLMAWYLVVVIKSGLSQAAYHTFLGHWDMVHQALDYQWLLFWPSIYVFGIVDAYGDAAEQNRICDMAFKHRMAKYLLNENEQRGAGPPP